MTKGVVSKISNPFYFFAKKTSTFMKPKGYHILEVYKMDKIFEETKLKNPCEHNIGVSCVDRKCGHCGWNPEVEQERKEKLREKFGYTK